MELQKLKSKQKQVKWAKSNTKRPLNAKNYKNMSIYAKNLVYTAKINSIAEQSTLIRAKTPNNFDDQNLNLKFESVSD